MKLYAFALALLATLFASTSPSAAATAKSGKARAEWSMNATIIEACSCPMFCQCYFTSKPAGHSAMAGHDHGGAEAEHYCRANNVFRVNKGWYGDTSLDGAKVWLSMDLGDDFTDGTMKWVVFTFDPAVTKAQREGLAAILGHLYPVKWEQAPQIAADLPIEWTHTGDRAVAKLDDGKAGEVLLNGGSVMRDANAPTVIKNLHYWGAPRNDGFVLMPNEIETYKLGANAFEFKGTNGFMITVDLNANDLAKGAAKGSE